MVFRSGTTATCAQTQMPTSPIDTTSKPSPKAWQCKVRIPVPSLNLDCVYAPPERMKYVEESLSRDTSSTDGQYMSLDNTGLVGQSPRL